jgi:rhodanese-related sulfurtransferase
MPTSALTHDLSIEEAEHHVGTGAIYIDLRPVREYLDVHIPRSVSLQYEFGPGFNTRARDCIPLAHPMVILDHGGVDLEYVTSSLRGKGFAVIGQVRSGVEKWAETYGTPSSCEVFGSDETPDGLVIDVGDPRVVLHPEATTISVERLWDRAEEFAAESRVTVLAGAGVRAALAVGMLERVGAQNVGFWFRPA